MSEDKSGLERKLVDLMEEYQQPVHVTGTRPNHSLISGLLGFVTAGVLAVGSFFAYQRFIQPSTTYPPQPTPIVEVVENPTPRPNPAYLIISLQEIGSPEESNLGLEAGINNLLDIPFETGWTLTTQCADRGRLPAKVLMGMSVPQPRNVYLLLQAGWALQEFDGKELGSVLLGFHDGEQLRIPLILGYNIRDWSRNKPEAVNTATSPMLQEAWQGTTEEDYIGGMDVLTIEIPGEYHQSTLTSIQINDNSIITTGSYNPCIHLLSVTVEYVK